VHTPIRCALFALLTFCANAAAAEEHLATDILREIIAQNTAPSGGNDLRPTVASLEARLRAAGFGDTDISIIYSGEKLPNLVVRYRSPAPTRRPLLMMAHLDVVEALPEDWTKDPFKLIEDDGYYYGRGTTDNKAGAAMLVANFIRLKQEGYRPDRDLIVMLTADEETTGNGAIRLANEHKDLIDAEFALNTDGGAVFERDGRAAAFVMQTAEKVYVSYRLEATDPGGHSSVPRADSAISRIARTLVGLHEHRFPIDLNETTRRFFEIGLPTLEPETADVIVDVLSGVPDAEVSTRLDALPYFNALLRTTCIATQISGGHAENAIPQTATAVINCRVLPQMPEAAVDAVIEGLASPNGVTVTKIFPYLASPPSPMTPSVVGPVTAVAQEFWPGIAVMPEMSTGATDGLYVRNSGIPVYAVSAIAEDPADIRAHGKDERIRIDAFERATEYWYRLVKLLSGPGSL